MDLVERLRQEGEDAMFKHLSMGMWRLCSEAADRIEQLEDDLQDCQSRAITQRGDLRYRIEQLEALVSGIEVCLARDEDLDGAMKLIVAERRRQEAQP